MLLRQRKWTTSSEELTGQSEQLFETVSFFKLDSLNAKRDKTKKRKFHSSTSYSDQVSRSEKKQKGIYLDLNSHDEFDSEYEKM